MASSDKALISGRTIPVSRVIQNTYGRCAALLLQQVHFWCASKPDIFDGEAWVCITYEAWAEQAGYCTRQIKRVVATLRQEQVLIVAHHNKNAYDRTLWYRVDYGVLKAKLGQEE